MLKHRLISAAVALAVIIPAIWYSHPAVEILTLLAAATCLVEFGKMMLKEYRRTLRYFVFSVQMVFAILISRPTPPFSLATLLFGSMVVLFSIFLVIQKDLARVPRDLGMSFLALIYISWALTRLIPLHAEADGHLWVLWVMTATFMGDTGAYAVGRKWGKNKLIPHVSPGKTWEGFAGQIVSAILGSVFFCFMFVVPAGALGFDGAFWLSHALWIGLICGVLGPVGDLAESMFKRAVGVKDSGRIMPGHGGLLDRLDGLLFTAPAVYLYMLHQQVRL